jgi:hypothetical protein
VTLPKLGRFLASEELHPVVSKANQINALAKLCGDFLPPELARQLRAANLKNGNLVMLAASPAAAAKLKLLSLGLGDFLLKQGQEVNSVSVRVQPRAPAATQLTRPAKPALSRTALESLAGLHAQWPDSPARAALGSLLAHQQPASRAGAPAPPPAAPEKTVRGSARRGKPRA